MTTRTLTVYPDGVVLVVGFMVGPSLIGPSPSPSPSTKALTLIRIVW